MYYSSSQGGNPAETRSNEGNRSSLIQIGLGTVGLELLDLARQWNSSSKKAGRFDYVGLADSSGLVINQGGFSDGELESIGEKKKDGLGLQEATSLAALDLVEAKGFFEELDNGVLVDVTDAPGLGGIYEAALAAGVRVVVANKIPLTEIDSDRFFNLKRAGLGYEATVGAGLPVIAALKGFQRQNDRIREIGAVLSGSLSYVLSRIEAGDGLREAVFSAKREGYTEPNPVEDLVGNDVARKALILARSIGMEMEQEEIELEPLIPIEEGEYEKAELERELDRLSPKITERAEATESKGDRLKYVARISNSGVTVGLEEVGKDSPLGQGLGTANAVLFRTENYDDPPLVIQGPGAGPAVTAAGVFAEVNVGPNRVSGNPKVGSVEQFC